ncbi:MAG: hypothetical protein U0401_07910 [Anaerolineae bacterium]
MVQRGLYLDFSAYQGVINTWHQVAPPIFVTGRPTFPYFAIKSNLALTASEPTHAQTRNRVFDAPVISHPLDVTMNNEVTLLGYDLPTRRVNPGENLPLTLYWQLLPAVRGDYFVFTHLLDANQTRQGGLERRLQEGYPIAFWYPGEVVTDQREIPVAADASNGLTWLRIGGYELTAGQTKPLPLVLAGQSQPETSLVLASVLIGRSAQVVAADGFKPQHALSVILGEPPVIALRGYDLMPEPDRLQLKLYWESLAPTTTDWMTFVHLRDETGKIVAQQDGPAGGGQYTTSLWQPGEIVADTVTLLTEKQAQSGYQLVIGLYDLTTGARLNVPGNPASEILLTDPAGLQ